MKTAIAELIEHREVKLVYTLNLNEVVCLVLAGTLHDIKGKTETPT